MTPLPTGESFAPIAAQITESLAYLGPEIVLSITACALILLDLFLPREKSPRTGYLALGGCALALLLVILDFHENRALFPTFDASGQVTGAMMVIDSYANFFKVLLVIGTMGTILLSAHYSGFAGYRMGEYYGLLVAALVGAMFMATANHLLMIFLAIEMVSIASYILVAYLKPDRQGSEAALKYVIYGSVSGGLMLYGMSLLYGLAGSAYLPDITNLLASSVDKTAIGLAFFLTFAGFAYKIAAFPMQFWVPDVYQGAPTPVTTWLAVASKAAGIAVFVRFMMAIGPERPFTYSYEGVAHTVVLNWAQILAVIAALTMTFGNLAALFQNNVKRLLAYSSIAHAGYILMGVAALRAAPSAGYQAVMFYMLAYLFMNLGAFAVVILVHRALGTEEIDGFRGLCRRHPILAASMAIFLLSLIGLPPTAGFSGKFQLFKAAVDQGLIWLAVVGAVNTAISVYYYARILKTMYLEQSDNVGRIAIPTGALVLVLLMVIPVLYFGLFFGGVVQDTHSLVLFSLSGR